MDRGKLPMARQWERFGNRPLILVFGYSCEIGVQAKGSKRQLRGRSPKSLRDEGPETVPVPLEPETFTSSSDSSGRTRRRHPE